MNICFSPVSLMKTKSDLAVFVTPAITIIPLRGTGGSLKKQKPCHLKYEELLQDVADLHKLVCHLFNLQECL